MSYHSQHVNDLLGQMTIIIRRIERGGTSSVTDTPGSSNPMNYNAELFTKMRRTRTIFIDLLREIVVDDVINASNVESSLSDSSGNKNRRSSSSERVESLLSLSL